MSSKGEIGIEKTGSTQELPGGMRPSNSGTGSGGSTGGGPSGGPPALSANAK